jgi:hypothetical protein
MKPMNLLVLAPLTFLGPVLWGSGGVSSQGEKPVRQYVGVDKCKLCHIKKTTGAPYMVWRKTKHAEAFKTLASPEAKKIAQEKGIADPQKSDECLRCHETAFGAKPEAIAATYKHDEGIGCEACHGPGSDYHKEEVHAKSREDALAAGMLVPDEKTCLRCHNKDSPSYKDFNYEEFRKQIEHPNPEKGK